MQNDQRLRLRDIRVVIRTRLWAQILTAMILGALLGLLFSPTAETAVALSPAQADVIGGWLRLPGSLFLNLIQMVVIPLITTSIILGLTSAGDPEFLRKAGLRIVPYFIGTTTIAVLIGIVIAFVIEPGTFVDAASIRLDAGTAAPEVTTADLTEPTSMAEQIANLIPANLSAAELSRNMIQIVIAAIFAGAAIVALGASRTKPLISLLQVVQEVAMKIVGWAMLLAPLAVFGLIGDFVLRTGISALIGMTAYIGSVILGLLILLGVYLLIVAVLARRNPLEFLKQVFDAQLLAFSTSSSAATMPLSLRIAEERLGIAPPVARFVIPLGATVNMDGTALYQVVAALFIAQVYGIVLDPVTLAVLIVTVVGASIGSPSTPGVGIVILATILQSIGIPPAGVAVLLGVDRILDMCRTAINVTGDLTAALVMNRWLGAQVSDGKNDALNRSVVVK
ncbi:dicarboxylate/amino acid:cation symporter [Tritonibacter mobilis]|uniref:dicarboxylate/amino acid:cation symporter n=1 Tax=Tritonibacter mobilis TaxID=379347 RepID=UPI000E0DE0D3|nr:dicarboxylate/amino acid:cation symporter [Tritonibacter mobilis]